LNINLYELIRFNTLLKNIIILFKFFVYKKQKLTYILNILYVLTKIEPNTNENPFVYKNSNNIYITSLKKIFN